MAKYAKYVGSADIRHMGREQWEAAGITDQEDLTFNASNGFTIPLDRVTEPARAVLERDPSVIMTDEAPTEDDIRDARIEAAKSRLRARQEGLDVLHAQDAIPAMGQESREE